MVHEHLWLDSDGMASPEQVLVCALGWGLGLLVIVSLSSDLLSLWAQASRLHKL